MLIYASFPPSKSIHVKHGELLKEIRLMYFCKTATRSHAGKEGSKGIEGCNIYVSKGEMILKI